MPGRGVVDRIVDQLEGDAEVAAEAAERVFGFFAGFGDDGGDVAGGGEQGGGFGLDDRKVSVFASPDLPLGGQLRHLSLGDHRRRAAEDLQDLETAVLDHQFEGAAKQEIADQHAGGIAPDEVGGALAAPGFADVHHVVVEQGRGVDEFDCGGEHMVAAAGILAQGGAGAGQHRPHPLATAGDQVTRKLRNERHLALHSSKNDLIYGIHVGSGQGDQRIEARRRVERVDGSGHRAWRVRAEAREGKHDGWPCRGTKRFANASRSMRVTGAERA